MIAVRQTFGTARLGVVAVCIAIVAAVPLSFPADGGPTRADREVAAPILDNLDRYRALYRVLVVPSDAYILIPLLFAAAAWFAVHRRWWRAATMLVVPEVAVAVNTWILKPLWDRPLSDYSAYPSGHTVHLVAIAATFVLLTDSVATRYVVVVVTALSLGGVAVGMIGLGYHLVTDVIGGAAAAIALVIVLCAPTRLAAGTNPRSTGSSRRPSASTPPTTRQQPGSTVQDGRRAGNSAPSSANTAAFIAKARCPSSMTRRRSRSSTANSSSSRRYSRLKAAGLPMPSKT